MDPMGLDTIILGLWRHMAPGLHGITGHKSGSHDGDEQAVSILQMLDVWSEMFGRWLVVSQYILDIPVIYEDKTTNQ